MTNLIRLTMAKTDLQDKLAGECVDVNPANIAYFHKYPFAEATVIAFVGSDDQLSIHVTESVDEIHEAIWRAEHPECRL